MVWRVLQSAYVRLLQTIEKVVSTPATPENNPFLTGAYAPVDGESGPTDCEVVGTLPTALNGEYARNGPNPKLQPTAGYHWFDGDGFVHAVRIKDGVPTYSSRYVDTLRLRTETDAGRALYIKVGAMVGRFALVRVMVYLGYVAAGICKLTPVVNTAATANTALQYHAGRLLALNEGDLPYQLTVQENGGGVVETAGTETFGGALRTAFTAHPKVVTDADGGKTMYAFGSNSTGAPYLTFHVIDKNGNHDRAIPIDIPVPIMMHDFGVTETRAVFLDFPVVFSTKGLAAGKGPFQFDKTRAARFGLLPLDATDASGMEWYELLEPRVCFHVMNAWEEENERSSHGRGGSSAAGTNGDGRASGSGGEDNGNGAGSGGGGGGRGGSGGGSDGGEGGDGGDNGGGDGGTSNDCSRLSNGGGDGTGGSGSGSGGGERGGGGNNGGGDGGTLADGSRPSNGGGGLVHVVLVEYPDFYMLEVFGSKVFDPSRRPRLVHYTIDRGSGRVDARPVAGIDEGFEFPQINLAYTGRQTRFGYGLIFREPRDGSSLAETGVVKVDLKARGVKYDGGGSGADGGRNCSDSGDGGGAGSGAGNSSGSCSCGNDCNAGGSSGVGAAVARYMHGDNRVGQEFIFVPDPMRIGGDEEDAGFLVGFVHDFGRNVSELVVLDAQRLSAGPVAIVVLPEGNRVPLGFHGTFLSEKELQELNRGAVGAGRAAASAKE